MKRFIAVTSVLCLPLILLGTCLLVTWLVVAEAVEAFR